MFDPTKEADQHHVKLISGLAKQMKPILDESLQPIYIYLDDTHKTCNDKFAKLLGYESVDDWSQVEDSFNAFVHKESREAITKAYLDASQRMLASTLKVTWSKRSGGGIETDVIHVPMTYEEHLFAIMFVSVIKQ
jgi:hypothetical protein